MSLLAWVTTGRHKKMKRTGIKINGEGLCGKGGGNFDLSGFLDIVFYGFSPQKSGALKKCNKMFNRLKGRESSYSC